MKEFERIDLEYVDGTRASLVNVTDLNVSTHCVEFKFKNEASKVIFKEHIKGFYAFPKAESEMHVV